MQCYFDVLQVDDDGNKVACAVLIKSYTDRGIEKETGGVKRERERDNLKEIKWLLMSSLFVRIGEFRLQLSAI